MKITEVSMSVLELPGPSSKFKVVRVPGLHRLQYTHEGERVDRPRRQSFLHVRTDDGIEGLAVGADRGTVDLLRDLVLGENPFHREAIFQKLEGATRWIYQRRGWFGSFDHCLWDILGKALNQPLCHLLGKVRDQAPVYLTGGNMDIAGYQHHIDSGRERYGIRAYKVHTYKGGRADEPIYRALRDYVGPSADYALLADPVRSYTLGEAIRIGRLLEELEFVWLEEPLHDEAITQLQELCATLTIPVLANETLQNDMEGSCQRLLLHATDLLRASGVYGVTQAMKMAAFAEGFGTTIEFNGLGGQFGAVSAHLLASVPNTTYYEMSRDGREMAKEFGIENVPTVVDGQFGPLDGPGFGMVVDQAYFQKLTIETY